MVWSTRSHAQPPAAPPIGPGELVRSDNGRLELRAEALRARWPLADLVTSDGHKLRGAFTCAVRAINEPAERKVLTEVFLARKPVVMVDDVIAHFAPTLHTTAANLAATKGVGDWLADGAKEGFADALHKAADKIAFNCGLELMPPFGIDLESPSFQQQKLEQLERNLAEQRVAGQVEHFEKAAALLKQFDAMRQAAPGLTPGAVLQQMSPSDQGAMLQTLLLAAGEERQTQSLWGVAGPYLVKIDPRVSPPKVELITLPADLGPLRSSNPVEIDGSHELLVGARNGVLRVNPEAPAHSWLYRDPEVASQLGFSSALVWRREVWACHGDAGIVAWDLQAPDHPKFVLRPAHLGFTVPNPTASVSTDTPRHGSPRNLTRLDDDRLIFSMGEKLFTISAAGQTTALPVDASRSDVVAILSDGRAVCVVREDGSVIWRDPLTLAVTSEERRGGRVNAAALLPWLGSTRLLLVSDEGPIACLGTEDGLVTQYLSAHRGLRVVTATSDLIAAISADRQRLVLWNTWDGKKPVGEVSVANVAKHRLGDVDFG